MPDEDENLDRRRFFRLGMSQLLRPLAAAAKPLLGAAKGLEKIEDTAAAASPAPNRIAPDLWLRPPGALAEQKFRDTCSHCGACVEICPVDAIQLDATGVKGHGVPFIEPDDQACIACEGLKCMHACPSGALVPTLLADIDMGTAVWHSQSCLRTTGEDCTLCIAHCPLGSAAIELKNNQIAVNPLGCIGCGVCQQDCPTTPKSITVIPIAAKTAKLD
jgi:ferredoxin-type protein NapG